MTDKKLEKVKVREAWSVMASTWGPRLILTFLVGLSVSWIIGQIVGFVTYGVVGVREAKNLFLWIPMMFVIFILPLVSGYVIARSMTDQKVEIYRKEEVK